MADIGNANILILATNGFEQSELEGPRDRLRDQGATVHVASLDGKPIKGWDKTDWGREVPVDMAVTEVDPASYDGIVIPGGQINPDLLRVNTDAVNMVRRFHNDGKVVAAICHGPWMLVEAGVVKGRQVTSYPSIKTDVINAGGDWHDHEVVADRGIVTSRKPDDIPAFVAKIVEEVEEGRHERKAA